MIFRLKEGYQEHWEIWVEGEKWREVHRSIFGRKPAFPSLSSEENLQSFFDAFEYRRVRGYVLWRLSTQNYHSEQLTKLLRDRLVQERTMNRILQEFRDMGFLDDESWLQNFMNVQQKRYSLSSILTKLRSKGLSADTIQRIAKEWKDPEKELQAIQKLLKTRYRAKDLAEYKERQKVVAALIRKGYSFDQVQTAFKLQKNER